MKLITYTITITLWAITLLTGYAQEEVTKDAIESLKEAKELVISQEKDALKIEVESIMTRLSDKAITAPEAEKLKKEVAEKRALNIENRLAIIDSKIELIKRNEGDIRTNSGDDGLYVHIGKPNTDLGDGIVYRDGAAKEAKYDLRTDGSLILAGGLNNAIIDGSSLSDSPYKTSSRFFELGFGAKTRVLKNSNFLRVRYGIAFQWNKYSIKDNKYFVQDGDITRLEEFDGDLNSASLRVTNLVVPLHFEFGPSKRIEKPHYFRYSTIDQFRAGIGGYAGLNIGMSQKLKYKVDGNRVKNKIKQSYNASDFVYGLSGYIGFDVFSIYAKYDLSPLFKNQTFDQRGVSIGLRMDLD